jgi:hypothetical protein
MLIRRASAFLTASLKLDMVQASVGKVTLEVIVTEAYTGGMGDGVAGMESYGGYGWIIGREAEREIEAVATSCSSWRHSTTVNCFLLASTSPS